MKVPPRSLVMGSPGKVKRPLTRGGSRRHSDATPTATCGYRLDYMAAQRRPGMTMAATQPARGTRDFLPDDVRRREYVIGVVREVYERYGFEPLETPAFENIETLLGKYGEEGNKLIFKILKRGEHEASGEADLALRYDLTVPLARVVAAVSERAADASSSATRSSRCGAPIGRRADGSASSTSATSTRSARPRRSSKRSCWRAVSRDARRASGSTTSSIRLNHRQVLTALLDAAGVPAAQHGDALVALDKLDKIGADGVREGVRGARHRRRRRRRRALTFFERSRAAERAERRSARLDAHARRRTTARREPARRSSRWPTSTPAAGTDPRRSEPRARPVILHGRDHGDRRDGSDRQPRRRRALRQPDRHVPRPRRAGVRVLARARADHRRDDRARMFPAAVARGAVDVMVTFLDDDSRGDALALAAELRASALRVDVYPETRDKFEKPLKYASARGAHGVAIVGEDERARGEVERQGPANAANRQRVARADAAAAIAGRARLGT